MKSQKFDPDHLTKRLEALKKKQAAAKKIRAEEKKKTKLAAVITMDPEAMDGDGYLPPPEDHPQGRSGRLLRKQRQHLRHHRSQQAIEALFWFAIALTVLIWCIYQIQGNGL